MAGEYSRELSTKVFPGCLPSDPARVQTGRLSRISGCAGCSSTRPASRKAHSRVGEHKSLQTDRVVLMPGPEEEQANRPLGSTARFSTGKPNVKSPTTAQRPANPHRPRPAVDPRHRASNPHQRKIHRQQRLSPDLLQIEAEAHSESAGDVDSAVTRRFSRHRLDPAAIRQGAGDHPRPGQTLLRTRTCSNALKGSFWTRHGRISGLLIDEQDAYAVQCRLPSPLRQSGPRLPAQSATRPARITPFSKSTATSAAATQRLCRK
jgi:hypothetical protein